MGYQLVQTHRMGKYVIRDIHRVIAISTIFQRRKTQVPAEVRKLLNIMDGDKILWVQEGGRIYVEPAEKSS